MASFNKITIVGYLGRDPEMRYTPSGDPVCNFSVATTEKRREEEITTWFRIAAWGKLAEIANEYLSKGKQVYVEGPLRQREYTNQDGEQRTALEVTAREIHFLGARGDEDSGRRSSATQGQANAAARKAALDAQAPGGIGDDDIPF